MTARVMSVIVLSGLLWAGAMRARAEDSPATIVQHMRDTYAELGSYADTGTVLQEYGPDSRDQHSFSTFFNRAPRHFLMDFRKQSGDRIVIWGDPDAFHSWWKETGAQSEYPNPNNSNAIILNDFPTSGAATKVTSLLYAKANLASALSNLRDLALEGTEPFGDRKCYRLRGTASDFYGQSGREVNVRKITLWIDTQSYLLRQVREEAPAAPGSLDRTTTTYQPRANPQIPATSFAFTAPR